MCSPYNFEIADVVSIKTLGVNIVHDQTEITIIWLNHMDDIHTKGYQRVVRLQFRKCSDFIYNSTRIQRRFLQFTLIVTSMYLPLLKFESSNLVEDNIN